MTEEVMVGWYDRLNRHEFEQAPGDGEGQGSLVCCSPWGCKDSDMTATEQQMVGRMASSKEVYILFPRTCEYVRFYNKGELKLQME